MTKILIIEDEEPIRRVLVKILTEENSAFVLSEAEDGKQGIKLINDEEFDLILCDIKMPKMDGLEVLEQAKKSGISTPFIMLTGHGNVETAVHAMKIGAYDFIPKPPDLNRLLISVRNAIASKHLIKENVRLKKKIAKKYDIIGGTRSIKKVLDLIDKVAPTQARILITGPNGTGKELVAHQIHQKSDRQQFPLIEVNCAAIPSELIESELFGHLKGAFTSAIKDRKGKFEAASQGTLFLDEIGDLSLSAQAKVLRALQENKVQRVGSDKDISVDVRILAATNKDLKKEIEKGRFREDLYHRLAVILIEVPSLADRTDDIPLLAEHFISEIAQKDGMPVKKIESAAMNLLKQYPWSGNVRELRNVIERLMILGDDPITKKNIVQFAPK
ncbi:MAG: sigma-54 dependent transcriptional regulator [Flavobacteriaceae bacterium]|jgi:two-component system nitrogen regulation response regulator NtrX|nr:sigma-54 dependent transcriptional regulator [Flavobacteriaceae bacterium]MDB4066452.1 sigma-54 dependent transcriptional regulator [Flavobacteriaceae bacterium]MDB4152437.1 sigma-54 dependent transcriptional regulator [Flavobacteriaceae bacterium]MDG1058092.1 sigma-54 dependent transcriptional regulator [Flavobacteriaceae bacterium]MDG1090528.1 sigma-54 dependent transcriptional regulator [Flavobacteriaceae bacterium]|tara:strand:+ start:2033 stop:3196 length:1164 start_codon:yes stop_codon:yes gene_type:complete